MNVERNWVLVMLIAGGLAGPGRARPSSRAPTSPSTPELRHLRHRRHHGRAARPRPAGRRGARPGLLFGALHAGRRCMQAATGTPVDIVQVLQALIVLFVAAPPLVRAMFRLRGRGRRRRRGRCPRGGTHDGDCRGACCRPCWTPRSRAVSAFRRWLAAARRSLAVFGLIDIFVLRRCTRTATRRSPSSQPFAKVTVPNLPCPPRSTCYVCGADLDRARRRSGLFAAAGQAAAAGGRSALVSFLFVVSLLCWADAGQSISFNIVNLLRAP